jgi:hypothetical protein
MKISSLLYSLARGIGKTASTLNDVETVLSGDPKKIVKRVARKATWKASNKITRKFTNKI